MPPMPRIKTNGVWVTWEAVHGTPELTKKTVSVAVQEEFLTSLESEMLGGSISLNSSGGSSPQNFSGPGGQSTRGPVRPPTAPVNKVAGTFVVAYQRYGPSGISLVNPLNGILQQRVAIQGHTGSSPLTCSNISGYTVQADNFINQMKQQAWRPTLVKRDRELQPADLKGTGTIFNQANLGLLLLHGTYGTSADFTAGTSQQMYFPIQTSATGGEYVRMSEMNFGSAGTNGLKWMAIQACNSLRQANWDSMQSHGITPFNGNLHLLLGTDSVVYSNQRINAYWAQSMFPNVESNLPADSILEAWFAAGTDAYGQYSINNNYTYGYDMRLAVAGYEDCRTDKLDASSDPGGDIFYESRSIYTR